MTNLRAALEFYANPPRGPEDRVPDFYDEMDFGERAREALAALSADTKGGDLIEREAAIKAINQAPVFPKDETSPQIMGARINTLSVCQHELEKLPAAVPSSPTGQEGAMREACAKVCDAFVSRYDEGYSSPLVKTDLDRREMKGRADAARFLAERIRALPAALASSPAQSGETNLEKFLIAAHDGQVMDKEFISRELAKAQERIAELEKLVAQSPLQEAAGWPTIQSLSAAISNTVHFVARKELSANESQIVASVILKLFPPSPATSDE